jgi:catechol 2,3-dioxygenase-like lactoylglutathione lyase family enzyme
MIEAAEQVLEGFRCGRLGRREAVLRIVGLAAAALGAGGLPIGAEQPQPTFQATGLNHLGLRVTDVARSRDFYSRHLGLKVIRDSIPGNCFLSAGENYVGLFRSDSAAMDHYCYTVDGYEPDRTMETLKREGFSPRREENRVYFEDPDGITVQLAGKWDSWPGPRPGS